jgi:hypothetical protein
MIKFFRHIRQSLIMKNQTSKYFKYAIGEIILVVIGILIALQINNWNNDQTDRKNEKKYLSNIIKDLKKDVERLEWLINFREDRLVGDQALINHINGDPIESLDTISEYVVNAMMEEKFSPNNITFLELTNSGRLNIIRNDSIKLLLLELEKLYKDNLLAIDHETFDYREYISKPSNNSVNVDQLIPIYAGQTTAIEQGVKLADFDLLFSNKSYKNGLYIMTFLSNTYLTDYRLMLEKSNKVIELAQRVK